MITRLLHCSFLLVFLAAQGCVTTTTSDNKVIDKDKALESNIKLGLTYVKKGKRDLANRAFQRALSISDKYSEPYMGLALIHEMNAEFDLADQNFNRALRRKAFGERSDVLMAYGKFLHQRERYKEAISQFNLVSKDYSYTRRYLALYYTGLSAGALGDKVRAKASFEYSLNLEDNFPLAAIELAEISFHEKDYVNAKKYLDLYSKGAKQSARSLWLGIRIERIFGNKDKEASYALALKNLHPYSQEYLEYKNMLKNNNIGNRMTTEPNTENDDLPAVEAPAANDQDAVIMDLRKVRELKEISLEEIHEQTNIPMSKLTCLESGEYCELGGNTYVLGYIKRIAKVLDEDPAPFIEAYKKRLEHEAHVNQINSEDKPATPPTFADQLAFMKPFVRQVAKVSLLQLSLGAIIIWIVVVLFSHESRQDETRSVGNDFDQETEQLIEAASKAASDDQMVDLIEAIPLPQSQPEPVATQAATVAVDRLKISVSGDCWVKVVDATGTFLDAKLLNAGGSLLVEGQAPFEVVLGDARVATVLINDTPFAFNLYENQRKKILKVSASQSQISP